MQPLSDSNSAVNAWRSGEWLLLPTQRRLLRDGKPVALDERVFDLIALLIANHESVLSQRDITTSLWGARPVSDNTLRQLVYKARKTLGDDGEHQTLIRTLPGRGLQWVAPVAMASTDDAPASLGSRRPARKRRVVFWASVAALVVLVVVAGVWSRYARAPLDGPIQRIAVEPIENMTGDKTLDWTSNGLPGLLAGLLAQSGGMDVLDPLQVARAWKYQPKQGRNREQQLRFATGADVLVGGRLRKLTDDVYELSLTVARADVTPAAITLTGADPSVLAVNAVKRIRRVLDLDQRAIPAQLPHDAFVAEAYARGIDMAAHGEWTEAQTHFKLCVESAPGFLPAYIKLGHAQYQSDQMMLAKQTLQSALKLALQRKDDDIAARALMSLGDLEEHRQRNAAALDLMQQAAVYAKRSGKFSVQAENILNMVEVNSALLNLQEASAQLTEANTLIIGHHLRGLQTALLAARRELANKRGDQVGEEAASRALLVENEAIGNQHAAVGGLLSLARVKLEHADFVGAASILQYAYTQAAGYHDALLTVASGDYLANTLLDLGVDERVDQIADNMVAISTKQGNSAWLGLAIALHGGASQYRGDSADALKYYQQAYTLLDPTQQPVNAAGTLFFVAVTAYRADPKLLTRLSATMDGIVRAQADRKPYRARQSLVQALTESAAHQAGAALKSLRFAADGKSGEALDSDVRMVAFAIGRNDKIAADVALQGFDPRVWKAATGLRFYAQWAASQGDRRAHDIAEARIAQLRKTGLQALAAPAIARVVSSR